MYVNHAIMQENHTRFKSHRIQMMNSLIRIAYLFPWSQTKIVEVYPSLLQSGRDQLPNDSAEINSPDKNRRDQILSCNHRDQLPGKHRELPPENKMQGSSSLQIAEISVFIKIAGKKNN